MSLMSVIKESDSEDTGECDTVTDFGVVCVNVQEEDGKWRTHSRGGSKPGIRWGHVASYGEDTSKQADTSPPETDAAWMGPNRASISKSGGPARQSRGHKAPPATPRNKCTIKVEIDSLLAKGVLKGQNSGGVVKRKVQGHTKARFVCHESGLPKNRPSAP